MEIYSARNFEQEEEINWTKEHAAIRDLIAKRDGVSAAVKSLRTAFDNKLCDRNRVLVDRCSQWTMKSLQQFPPGKNLTGLTEQHWAKPLGLGFTVAPVECLTGLGWDTGHLQEVQSRHQIFFLQHLMKTGGTSMRQMLLPHVGRKAKKQYNQMYNHFFRIGQSEHGNITYTIWRMKDWNVGHLLTHAYNMKFKEFRHMTSFNTLTLRDPLLRGLSVYDYFDMPAREVNIESFFTQPGNPYGLFPSVFWTVDVFWYLGMWYPNSTKDPADTIELMERAKFQIRNNLILISERTLESVALLSAVMGEPTLGFECVTQKLNERGAADDPRPIKFTNITRYTVYVAMQKMRYMRVLYEYAVDIFNLRMRQFGVMDTLRAQCTPEVLEAEGVGFLDRELQWMDDAQDVLPEPFYADEAT